MKCRTDFIICFEYAHPRLSHIIDSMNENVTVVFHGFLNLNGPEKLKLVESINEYFDSMNREPIREANETAFAELGVGSEGKVCKCCGR